MSFQNQSLFDPPVVLVNNLKYQVWNPTEIIYFFTSRLLARSFLIKVSSRPLCPFTEVFSFALRIRYGIVDLIGP